MFKNLVTDIPFNPSLIEHIPQYRTYLRKERKLRLIGLFIFLLAFILQIFITIFPANSAVNYSPNDLLTGGFNSQSVAVRDCYNNVQGYKTILSYFSIDCTALDFDKVVGITANSHDNQLYSINRLAYGGFNEHSLLIDNQQFWTRPLSQGFALNSAKQTALSGTTSKGAPYYILFNSGNLVFIGNSLTSSSCNSICPELNITARDGDINNANNTTAKPNDTIIYTLSATNISNKRINSYVLGTNFSSALTYSKINNLYGGYIQKNNYVFWPATQINPGQTVVRVAAFQVESKITTIPLSSSDSNYYNSRMTTVFGNSVTVKAAWTNSKYFELKINNGFPSVGEIWSLIITSALLLWISYMYYRSNLLLKELNNVKDDYLNGGRD